MRTKKINLSWCIRFASVLFGLGTMCIIALTWFAAYFNHDWITVRINKYGERDFELLMWIVLGPVFMYGLVESARRIWRERIMDESIEKKEGVVV